ncbi:pectinesterase-like [Senna tora]|uniref:Pectinesterase-like n=1 Tax=Senna tora TaxID=362788 RepID=A0A834TKG0_9FABA|nr:pectinesterase-like [Senna tora]
MVLAGERRRCYEHRAKTQASKSIFHLLRLVRFALDVGTFASVAPAITLGSISKRWIVAAWRLGFQLLMILMASFNETRFDFVVAKDGTGNFTTIGEAVAAAPNSSTIRHGKIVIHIKARAYMENVEVMRKKRNLMLVGDGIGNTIVKAGRNVIDGWTTFLQIPKLFSMNGIPKLIMSL